jgi:ribokinase
MRVAVVGHVEWIRFARVDRIPGAGEISHSFDQWEQAGGAGAVAAVQLALLADEATLFTVLGDDDLGRRATAELEGRGVVVRSGGDERPQRWAFTQIDDQG